ncbi:hypothetical protein [Neomegalonema sp.]|uniref:hypothetical protein n=1 Tax=Neomegalonema sp. TaxID=2039713 RepID=UPI00262CC0F8|nr:hypothetical protein [Neomegalonema sp.]MDD2867930.1 hypothetical protein [Neomegalonema sp.]
MTILAYQALIVVTIALGRLASRDRFWLVGVCWTIFTFVKVHWTPLILLQLCVIWTTCALLAPKKEASS